MKNLLARPCVLACALLTLALAGCTRPQPVAEPIRSVRVMAIDRGSMTGSQEYAAEVRARVESRLAFRVGGKLSHRLVEVGQTVRAGQVLARLDPADLKLGEDAAQAAVRAARVQADQAAADMQRYADLRRQGFISEAELERRESLLKAAQAQWEQARSQAAYQANQTTHSNLVADAPGVVVAIDAEVGAVVSPGIPVVRVAWDGPRDVTFTVPEDRVMEFRRMQGVAGALQVRLWADQASAVRAVVREVAALADPLTRTFLVKAGLEGASPPLGLTATVRVDSPRALSGIRVPSSAVLEQHGQASVWVVDPASLTVNSRAVRIAGADRNDLMLEADLRPGDLVVTAGVHTLTPGQKVRLFQGPGSAASRPMAAVASAPASAPAAASASR